MQDSLERKVSELEHAVRALQARIDRLEGAGSVVENTPAPAAAEAAVPPPVEEATPSPGVPAVSLIAYLGRTLLVLAGAFLLRAITDAGVLDRLPGTIVGLAYSLVWIVLADRIAARGDRPSAVFHGIASCLIAFPLIGEAASKYGLLPPGVAAGAIVFVSGLLFLVAGRGGLPRMAWATSLGVAATCFALAFVTGTWVPYGYPLLAMAVFTLALGYARGWNPLAWTTGFLLNLFVLVELVLALLPGKPEGGLVDPGKLTPFLLILVVVYVAVFGRRTLFTGSRVKAFEIVQSLSVILMGILGAVLTSRTAGLPVVVPAFLSLALAVGAYTVAFRFVDRQADRRTNFLYYTTLALPLTLIAADALLDRAPLAYVCCVLAVAAAWLGAHFSRVTPAMHSAVYALVAVVGSGLFATATRSFVELPALGAWASAPALAALLTVAVCSWIQAAVDPRTWGRLARAPKLMVLALLVWGIAGLLVALVFSLTPWARGEVDPGALATLRTGVLAATALVLGGGARFRRLSEARWLVYPLLALGGLHLVVDDFPHGRPITLVLSLALLGSALILAPRLSRRSPAGA